MHLVQEEVVEPKILLFEEGECLLLRKGEPVPQATIFRSKCLVQGKVCDFIIDSGAHNNLVSTDMVTKLGLPIVDHPNPYKATWVNQVMNVEVSQRALVSFSIGPYQE